VLLKLVKYIITQIRARNLPPLKFPPRANVFNVDPARCTQAKAALTASILLNRAAN